MNLRNLSTELALAVRYLKPQRNAVSVITSISVIGVMLGVAVLIVVLAVMSGFTDMWKDKILDTTAHFRVAKWGQATYQAGRNPSANYIAKPDEVMKRIYSAVPDVKLAEAVETPVLVQSGERFEPKLLIGINPDSNPKADELHRNMKSYGPLSLEKNEIVISSRLAGTLNLFAADKILLHSPSRLAKMIEVNKETGKIGMSKDAEVSLPSEFKISGLYSFDKYDFDMQVLFTSIDNTDELLGIPWGSANVIYGWVKDPFDMRKELSAIQTALPGYQVYGWEQMNKQFLDVLAMEKTMMFFLLVFIVLVAAFSIMNTLITVVVQKTREIGVLKSLGATSGAVMRIFLFQGLIVGLIGNCAGMLLGILVVTYRNGILTFGNQLLGRDLWPAQFYFFAELPGRIVIDDLIVIGVVSVLLCTLGAVIPAFRAARLDPAKALRYE